MKTVTYKVYNFNELSYKAKQKAIAEWYENEDYPWLSDNLTESCKMLLEEKRIYADNLKLYYSLSCRQGDGLCFIGTFEWKRYYIKIEHSGRYYYTTSTDIKVMDKEKNETDNQEAIDQFNKIYIDICKTLEKEGYATLEYRMDFEEFQDLCESNEYTFTDDGVMDNQ